MNEKNKYAEAAKKQIEELKEKLCKSRSEVMRQRECIAEISTEHDELIDEFEKAKTEVAREIFEEIENLLTKDNFRLIGNRSAFAELKKKYTEGYVNDHQ